MLFESKNRLYLLDGMALIYRAHYALIRSPRFTSSGLCTSAVFGLANTLLDILLTKKPTHMAAAFDTPEPTERHQLYPEYKANRDQIPEDLLAQFPLVDELLQAMRIPVLRFPGFEADDVIGTLARIADEQQFSTWMVTPDKDFQQLVSERSSIYRPGRKGSEFEILGPEEVCQKWQIERVEQLIDILGLMGDASDNIPGVHGFGEKTAQKLIQQYGSIESLLASTDQLKGKQKELLESHREMAVLSKRLATIRRDVPLSVTLDDLQWHSYDADALQQFLQKVEFDTLGKRLFGSTFSSANTRTNVIRERREREIQKTLFDNEEPRPERAIAQVSHRYQIVRTPQERSALIALLKKQKSICFDTETTSLNPREAEPVGISFAFQPHEAYYVACPVDPEEGRQVLLAFQEVWADPEIEKIGHNLKYDMTMLKWHGIEVHGTLMDTMLAHAMKEPEMRHGLDYLSQLYLGYSPIPITDLIGPPGPDQKNMQDIPVEQIAEYACEDADVTLQVSHVLRPDIEARGVSQVCYEVECPLIPVLIDMEYEGIRLDIAALEVCSSQLQGEIDSLRERIFAAAGHEFNIDSPRQLGTVLYEELQIEANPKKTATGQYSTREPELLRLANRHTIIQDILEYRNCTKLKSVYVDQLPGQVHSQTGRLHTHYSQNWTATGRIQSNDPNLQTIPIRTERGREIRAAFVPRDENYLILAADYSQIELRLMAELSQDPAMLSAFDQGVDIHQVTAARAYHVELDQVSREMRNKAKMVNFGILYGISGFGLQQRLNIPRQEANELIKDYFRLYPGVRSYIDETIRFARENGYVQTQTGRRRYLRDINSQNQGLRSAAERLAMNSPIQGTAADMLKLAMIKVHRALRSGNYRTKMLLTVHDEIVFDLHKDEQETVLPIIEENMRTALPLRVPIVVELGVGKNWLEAH